MKFSVKDLQDLPHIRFENEERIRGVNVRGVSTDSRSLSPGDLFIAIRGEHFDGHRFVTDAFRKGAVAAIVENPPAGDVPPDAPWMQVESTVAALGELARMHRRKFSIPVIAVGGSNGKTTTKEMLAAVLGTEYRVLSTSGNLNNHIGVPQTIFGLHKKHEVAVVEIGTNHPGEIAALCNILEPTHGLVTNMGREHLEFFGSVEGVANEEGALFDFLSEHRKSVAFVNADDERVVARARQVKRRQTYGIDARKVDVRGRLLGLNERGCAGLDVERRKDAKRTMIQLAIPGEHHARNALAAAAVGIHFGVSLKKIRKALENFHPASKRMEVVDLEGVMVFNDTYNANPDSVIAALRTLAAVNVSGKRIAVLADMRELGDRSAEEHTRIGREVAALGIDYLLTFGEHARYIGEATAGVTVFHYDQKNVLAEYLAELISPGDAVLVKGSRAMKMEEVVAFLEERLRQAVVPFG
jgi:UDP-N-acetylmuramoyl-tripeptide--D-alanyl-D-alanine ligase